MSSSLAATPALISPPSVRLTGTGPWRGLDLVPSLGARNAPEPEQTLITDPSVPLGRWRCRECRSQVGTAYRGQDALRAGRCPMCGTRYSPESYAPRLRAGDVVDHRYEILGCVGQGGVGWVYAARDRNLDGHWVALKGLVDDTDEISKNAVKAEKHFMLSIDHERIVRIQDSVFHPTEDGRLDLYLVMEYIRGYPLSDERFATHPLEEVVGCVLQILQAMDHLHRHGYLFCDLKPSNVMLSPTGVKLIDLGAVNSEWSTLEYAAPELSRSGPSVVTDLYTVGRTLEVLVERRDGVPDALRRVIGCAKDDDPARRFDSAEAFADQLSAVLVALAAPPGQVTSRLFAPGAVAFDSGLGTAPLLQWWTSTDAQQYAAAGTSRPLPLTAPDPRWAAPRLPEPHPDPRDQAAGFLAASVSSDPLTAASQLAAYGRLTPEILFRRCRVRLGLAEASAARSGLDELPGDDENWRRVWLRAWHLGLIALSEGDAAEAASRFRDCSGLVPGESAPRFALALCEELQGRHDMTKYGVAKDGYAQVWAIDRSCEGAAFGLARILLREGERAEAVGVLDQIPGTSPHHRAARIAALRVVSSRLGKGPDDLPHAEDLRLAVERLGQGSFGDDERQRLTAGVLESALELAGAGIAPPDAGPLSASDGPPEIRGKLEEVFRTLRHQTSDLDDQTILTDLANSVRKTTWW